MPSYRTSTLKSRPLFLRFGMFPNRRFVHLCQLGKPLVANDRFDRCQPFPVRRGLHRMLQRTVCFKRVQRNQLLGFTLDSNRLGHGVLLDGVSSHYAKSAKNAR